MARSSPTRTLCVEYDVLPPTDNHIREVHYITVNGKRMNVIGYTKDAENYKKHLIRHINDQYFHEVQAFSSHHLPWSIYLLTIFLVFPPAEILNSGWLKGKAKTPYKKNDLMNRRKLLEDALSEATGVDDSHFWEGDPVKVVRGTTDLPAVTLLLEERDPRCYGVPPEYMRGPHG